MNKTLIHLHNFLGVSIILQQNGRLEIDIL